MKLAFPGESRRTKGVEYGPIHGPAFVPTPGSRELTPPIRLPDKRASIAFARSFPRSMSQWGHSSEAVDETRRSPSSSAKWRLQWGHSSEAVDEERRLASAASACSGFNGATARKLWMRRPNLPRILASRGQLQWGHSSEAVDEVLLRLQRSLPERSLQWGHSSEAVDESSHAVDRLFAQQSLQWGHSSEAVDEASKEWHREVPERATSMGPQLGSCG